MEWLVTFYNGLWWSSVRDGGCVVRMRCYGKNRKAARSAVEEANEGIAKAKAAKQGDE